MLAERRRTNRDRRGSRRIPLVVAVRHLVSGDVQLGQTEDIGLAGITLRRHRDIPLAQETPLSLAFNLPGLEATILATGKVVSDGCQGNFRRTGVALSQLTPEHRALISAYCQANL